MTNSLNYIYKQSHTSGLARRLHSLFLNQYHYLHVSILTNTDSPPHLSPISPASQVFTPFGIVSPEWCKASFPSLYQYAYCIHHYSTVYTPSLNQKAFSAGVTLSWPIHSTRANSFSCRTMAFAVTQGFLRHFLCGFKSTEALIKLEQIRLD